MKLSIDVAVPCYNYGHLLKTCVDSVLSQSGVDVRVLIIDDTSKDNTAEVGKALAEGDSRVTFRRHAENKGHIATFNEGIDWASAQFFMLLSADDYLLPGALDRASRVMSDKQDVGFTFGNVMVLSSDGTAQRVTPLGQASAAAARQPMSGAEFIRLSGGTNIVSTPTALVRTSLQKQVGGYHVELPHTCDMEMWLRLASRSAVGFINDDQAVYRRHVSNMSLGYLGESMLPDLQQRRKAFEILFTQTGAKLTQELQSFLVADLARDALRYAGMAFNRFDLIAADAIQRFALEVSPDARKSLPWLKLAIKRAIGPRSWFFLNSLFQRNEGTRA